MIARLHADDIRSYAYPVVILAMGALYECGYPSYQDAVEGCMQDLNEFHCYQCQISMHFQLLFLEFEVFLIFLVHVLLAFCCVLFCHFC